MQLSEIQNTLSKRLSDKYRYYATKLENCQSLDQVLSWVHQSCNPLAGAGILTAELLLSLFTRAQLDGVQVFVRQPDQEVLIPEKQKVQGFYFVFGGKVVQTAHNLHAAFYEGTVAEVKAGRASFYANTSGTLNGPSTGSIFGNARVTAMGSAHATLFNEASGVGKDHSHLVCMGNSVVELHDKSFGLAMERSKVSFHDQTKGRAMGESICLCQDKSEVLFGEKAQGLILTSGHIESTGTNVLYQFSSKASISTSKTTSLHVLPSKDADKFVSLFNAYVPASGGVPHFPV